ncbi:hypothetical protein PoB_000135700 [Plakobranchus ocellatus]|uniref:Uncharacterized protein n=1 Tax=Plakobranchus ocellatus TaxID=259542 RepID=A0AAV3XWM2_9GAST|nr:hypothetical protein PoB_000135700 [Plakobranchus ocellatus]
MTCICVGRFSTDKCKEKMNYLDTSSDQLHRFFPVDKTSISKVWYESCPRTAERKVSGADLEGRSVVIQWIASQPRSAETFCRGFEPRHQRSGLTKGLKA